MQTGRRGKAMKVEVKATGLEVKRFEDVDDMKPVIYAQLPVVIGNAERNLIYEQKRNMDGGLSTIVYILRLFALTLVTGASVSITSICFGDADIRF